MKVLITGANGFVGNALVQAFRRSGAQVCVAVRAVSEAQRRQWGPVGISIIRPIAGDIRWTDSLAGVDVVVHLAARVHVMRDRSRDPLTAFRAVNTEGTLNFARQAAASGVRRFVYVSSIKVNGEVTQGVAFREADTPNPQDPYAISKWEAEQGLRALAQAVGLEVVVVRPPLVYGPGVKGNFIALLKWLELGIPLPLKHCDNRRSLLALDNLVDLLVTCAEHPAAAGETFLAADGTDLSTAELLRCLGSAMRQPARLWPLPPAMLRLLLTAAGRRGIYERLCGSLQIDASKARTRLAWSPPVTVEEGLRRVAAWYTGRG